MMLCNHPVRTASEVASSQQRKSNITAVGRAAAKSKSKLWGPSHSYDSDDTSSEGVNNNNNKVNGFGTLGAAPRPTATSWWETMGQAWQEFNTAMQTVKQDLQPIPVQAMPRKRSSTRSSSFRQMEVVPEVEEVDEESTDPSTRSSQSQPQEEHDRYAPAKQSTTKSPSTSNAAANVSSSNTGDHRNGPTNTSSNPQRRTKMEEWTDLLRNPCGGQDDVSSVIGSPCSAQELERLFQGQRKRTNPSTKSKSSRNSDAKLGIAPLQMDHEEDDHSVSVTPPHKKEPSHNTSGSSSGSSRQHVPKLQKTWSDESPAERRRQRAKVRQSRHEQVANMVSSQMSIAPHEDFEVTSQQDILITPPTTTALLQSQSQRYHNAPLPPSTQNPIDTVVHFPPQPQPHLPIANLIVKQEEAQALERSISELTMRSSYYTDHTTHLRQSQVAPAACPQADQRRMAYYAVGRHHRLSGPRAGGNRRCYFTGKLIFGGAPFYAGIVQQGLRTLVVFCLPSALGMPQNLPAYKEKSALKKSVSKRSLLTSSNGSGWPRSRRTLASSDRSSIALSKSPSKLSSTIHLDDMSLSIEGDIDPNWNLDKDYLLKILPEPSDALLSEMNQRYPEQFETLPVQVRLASCWKIFVKFCFFSGLPIQEGELHYQVRAEIALELYGEDIVLSHDVMEAVNGVSSAEILTLPNQKTFRYLRRNYQQQSAKLPEIIFQRSSWEQVKAEV